MITPQHRAIEALQSDVCYVITYTTEKSKTSVTGYFVGGDLTEVVLLTQRGQFRKIPIEKIIRINYYQAGRAPF